MPQYCKSCYKEKINPAIKEEDLIYTSEEKNCDSCGELKHLVIEPQVTDTPVMIEPAPEDTMTEAECRWETQKHIETVRKYIRFITDKLTSRGVEHDASKLASPEVECFAKYTKLLSNLTFGSEEYTACLAKMDTAIKCHYSRNNHHPEHYPNGINDMSLIDIVEMVCDWKASSERQHDGNILKTIDVLAERFNISKQLKQIIINTVKLFEDLK